MEEWEKKVFWKAIVNVEAVLDHLVLDVLVVLYLGAAKFREH